MGFEKVLVGYAALYKADALLLNEFSNQNMEISHFLVRSRKTVVYHKMDFLWVPDLLNTHLTEDFDRQGSGTILGHGHVCRQNGNLSRMVNFPTSVSLDANDLLRESKRVIVKNRLRQLGREAGRKLSLLKMKPKRRECKLVPASRRVRWGISRGSA